MLPGQRFMERNTLYFGDNLDILRKHIPNESVDLIYLDPPFNSQQSYNVLFASPKGQPSEAQITAFEDTWHWGEQAEREYNEIIHSGHTDTAEVMIALRRVLKENDMLAYLVMMANRLIELHRVLKPTGSLYLHCDPAASHYLKIVLDAIFGPVNFRNEIIWKRTTAKGLATRRLPDNHDVILSYQKSDSATWNNDFAHVPYDEDDLDPKTAAKYNKRDADGRRYTLGDLTNPNPNRPNLTYEFLGFTKVWRWTKDRMQKAYEQGLVIQPSPGAVPRIKRYLDERLGKALEDVWTDIPPLNSQAKERLGYPTQKPVSLLERIINMSSNPGDVVLDPFAGCGTAVIAAQKLGRRWIGIDITHLAISLVEKRLKDAFADIQFDVEGTPKDAAGARDLAQRDKYQFQWWACSLVNAQPYKGKQKGADKGIDGLIFFTDIVDNKPKTQKIIVSVKGGDHVGVTMVRELLTVVQQNDAEMGFLVTLAAPTQPMVVEAAKAGFYRAANGREYPRLQILTIDELLSGRRRPEYMDYRHGADTFKRAQREDSDQGTQQELL
jgi:site-specific DNA-methyltransferase (adenine-specific)